MYTVIDAAYPPLILPKEASAVMGYIGGARATNVWSLGEWQRFAHVKQYPIWVPDLTGNPLIQAEDAVKAALDLGWAPWQRGNGERALIFDLETGADALFWQLLQQAVCIRGFVPVCYGSQSTVYGNRAAAYVVADWTGHIPVLPEGETEHGIQYEANSSWEGTRIDFSVFDQWLFDRGGMGPRHD
jgi:hypothetical protein